MDNQVKGKNDEEVICKEWLKEAKVKVDLKEVHSCLFGNLPDSLLSNNAFYKAIKQNPELNRYFLLCKQNEVTNEEASLYNEPQKPVRRTYELEEVMRLYKSAPNEFYRKRYAYQLLVMSFYQSDYWTFQEFYHRHFNLRTNNSPLDWWAHHYKSMVLESEGKTDSANFYHAMVFSNSNTKRMVSKRAFSVKNFEATVALTMNPEEKANMYLLKEIINPGRSMEGIQRIIELYPNHPHLPLLISREVNKIEDWLGTPKYNNSAPSTLFWKNRYGEKPYEKNNWKKDYQYAQAFASYLEQQGKLRQNTDLHHLSLASLYLITDEKRLGENHLELIKSNSLEVRFEQRLLRTVAFGLDDIKSERIQNEIGKNLNRLFESRFRSFESQKRLLSLCNFLKHRFEKAGMKYFAGLFDNYANNKFCYTCGKYSLAYSHIKYYDEYADARDLEMLIEVFHKKSKNQLEEVLLMPYQSAEYFYDLLSVMYLRKGDVKRAYSAAQEIHEEFWMSHPIAMRSLDADPFTQNKELLMDQTLNRMGKKQIIESLLALEEEAERKANTRANNYFLLGNAWYNFTDNSDYMLNYGTGFDDKRFERNSRFSWEKSIQYYKRALVFTKDAERKARLLYMISVCYKNMGDKKHFREQAKAYKLTRDTEFYKKRNCLTIEDMEF